MTLDEIREEASTQIALWWVITHPLAWSKENLERVHALSQQWSECMSKRVSALAPRTIEDLRARLALPDRPPDNHHLWPERRVVGVEGGGRVGLFRLECGHAVPVNDRSQAPHSSHCRECWGSE